MAQPNIQIVQDLPSVDVQEAEQEIEDTTGSSWKAGVPPSFHWTYSDEQGTAQFTSDSFHSCDDCCKDIQEKEQAGTMPSGLPIYGSADCSCERVESS